jgi:hypothetical protein
MMMRFFPPWLFLLCSILMESCSSSIYKEVYPTLIDGRYDSEFPYKGCSTQLEEVSETIKQITVMAHYKTYSFSLDDSVRSDKASIVLAVGKLPEPSYQDHNVAGTGTIIFNEDGKIALLTCAHIVDFSDTVVTRYSGPDYRPAPFIRSISLKTGQIIFLNGIAGTTSLDILALNRSADLAIIGQKLTPQHGAGIRVFTYPLGKAKELEWGSFVYLFGYPSGFRMITKGIVSLSSKLPPGSFVVDAVISPGASGSIALAIRDGVPNFELVGIIKMIPARTSYTLIPSLPSEDVQYDPLEPYHGEVYVERKTEIQEGIALAVPIETVLSFIEENRRRLAQLGYDLSSWVSHSKNEKQ